LAFLPLSTKRRPAQHGPVNDALVTFGALLFLLALAALAPRFGVDSRDGFAERDWLGMPGFDRH